MSKESIDRQSSLYSRQWIILLTADNDSEFTSPCIPERTHTKAILGKNIPYINYIKYTSFLILLYIIKSTVYLQLQSNLNHKLITGFAAGRLHKFIGIWYMHFGKHLLIWRLLAAQPDAKCHCNNHSNYTWRYSWLSDRWGTLWANV